MPARRPEDADLLISRAINDGDVDAALSLYEPDASFVVEGGKVATGTQAIRQVLSGMMSGNTKVSIEEVQVFQAGDIALTSARWNVTGTGADGKPVNESGKSAEVVRRQPDGTWLFVIDNPSITD
jgi:uncharacterized protein (TIGR02246 family)